jgi:hypothetical protein
LGCDFFEELLNIYSRLCAYFFEMDLIPCSELSSFGFSDVSVLQINFISKEGNNDSISPLVFDIVNPFLYRLEGGAIGDIIDNDGDGSIANIVRYECFKSLLTSSVPQLQTDGLILEEDILRDEVNSNGRSLKYFNHYMLVPVEDIVDKTVYD